MKNTLITTALLSLISFSALADSSTKTYDVKYGFAKTFSISTDEQIGEFKAILKTEKESHKKKKWLVLQGVIKGVLNDNFTLTHSFVNKNRNGVIYTANDSITNVYAGDFTCENGTGSTPLKVEETLNIVAGTGIYQNIEAGSFIVLKGVINNCPSLAEYGQNTFEITGGKVSFSE